MLLFKVLSSKFRQYNARSSGRRLMVGTLGALVFSCMPQSQAIAPDVAPSQTINLDGEEAGKLAPFSLVHHAPQGPTTGDPQIHLIFSRPLIALGTETHPLPNIDVQPSVPGQWQWVGTHGLTFVPESGRLPRATAYRVSIPASVQALDGSKLGQAISFDFESPRPRVTAAHPNQTWEALLPSQVIQLSFSQPVQPSKLNDYVIVKAGEVKLDVQLRSGETKQDILVSSPSGWPLDSTISFSVLPGYLGDEGTLKAEQSFTGEFKTYGPLVASVECDRRADGACRPEGGLRLELSNPVPARQLARAISAQGTTLHVDQDWSSDAQTRYISLESRLIPRSQFEVKLAPIKDIYGQNIKWVKDRQVVVGDLRPSVRIGVDGELVPLDQAQLGILAVNASYELVTVALSEQALTSIDKGHGEQLYRMIESQKGAKKQTISVGALNEHVRQLVDLETIAPRGPFALGIRYQSEGHEQFATYIGQRSNLGITVKQGREQSHLWVTDLKSGASVSNAEVRLSENNAVLRTDARGMASLPAGIFVASSNKDRPLAWLSVATDKDRAYGFSRDTIGSWRIGVDSDFYGDVEDRAFLFPERDLFRPGERAWLKAYVRRPDTAGYRPLAGESLDLNLYTASGELASTQKVKTNRYGAVSAQVLIPGSAALGYWSAQVKRGEQLLASTHLQVAEYRAAEFEVKVQAHNAQVTAGQKLSWDVRGEYFYGGMMSGAPVSYTLSRRPSAFRPAQSEDYETSDEEWQYHQPYKSYDPLLASDEAKLDDVGKWSFEALPKLEHQIGPEQLELEATVQDLSGQTISGRGSVQVDPAQYYLGIKHPESYLIDAPGVFRPLVRTMSRDGKIVVGKRVELSLYRLRWTYAKQKSGEGSGETVSELVSDLVSTCYITSDKVDQSCGLSVQDSGQHLLRASSTDQFGHQVFASTSFYAVGGGRAAAFRDYDERAAVELVADRTIYKPGQTARILVKSPFAQAQAWVTIERDNVLEQRLVKLSGSTPTIEVAVTDKMRPNVYVGVHLVEDRASLGKKAHIIGDSYRFGYAELRVDPERQRLTVNLQAHKPEYRPGEIVKLDLKVADNAGKPRRAEVSVFVVDEGVLSLSGYQLPDPLLAFTAPRPLRVETIEARETVARNFGLEPNQNENKGDTGGDGGEARSEMLTTAYFNPSIETDVNGKAHVEFKLPDNLGRFRIMALAVTEDDRYGKGQSSFNVNKLLMVRPALPRFLRAGDELQLSAVVSALGFQGGAVKVKAEVDGLVAAGPMEATLQLSGQASEVVNFAVKTQGPRQALVRFSVTGVGATDSVELKRTVQSPAVMESVALYGKTERADAFRLGQLSEARTDVGGLDVTLSSSALVGLRGGFEQLWDYPYLCSEQLASRILPLVMLNELAAVYGVQAPKDAAARVDHNVALLVRRQLGDGGFGMWPESTESSPWVSAYSLWVLWEAKNKGHMVSADVFERGSRYLRDLAARRRDDDLRVASFSTLVLGRIGRPDQNTIHALVERLPQMDVESQFILAWAAAENGAEQAKKILLARVEGAITVRGNEAEITPPQGEAWASTMGSETRLHAIALHALLRLRPDHPLAAALVRSLLSARQGGSWGNTQESAFALLALNEYRLAQEKVEPNFDAFVFLRDKLLGQKRFAGRSVESQDFSVQMRELTSGGDLIFQRKGAGTLFYEARLKYARQQLPSKPVDHGFWIGKQIHVLDQNEPTRLAQGTTAPSVMTFAHGDLVVVDLTVLAPTRRRFVVIDDPLPAGFESIDFSQQTAQGSLAAALQLEAAGYSSAWHRTELRDDRALYFIDDMPPGVYKYRYLARATARGSFVVPPSLVKEMYQEEVYGRTGASEVFVQ